MAEQRRYLRFAQTLAFVGIGCSASSATAPPPSPGSAAASTSSPAASTAEPKSPSGSTSTAVTTGPCRCSWDTNPSTAARVCKHGEINYDGEACVPGDRKKPPHPPVLMKGPLPPPDLPDPLV